MDGSGLPPTAGIDWDTITGRPPFAVDRAAVERRVAGRVVAVTGAAGSLGAPLASALAAAGPRRLVLYDHHESSLFRLRQALGAAHPHLSLGCLLGDVREARRVRHVFGAERPALVFHLAAYKHVPWGEEDPRAFAEANVLGAQAVLDASRETGVDQVVYPSTDKAIDPPSVYGATKRLVEGMLQAAAAGGGPRCAIVRFVNVLGSQGSAPETFARQLRAGRPLSVTHPAMRRYWITPDHARLLLLHAACLPDACVTVAPDAGDEIAIVEIARRLARALRPGAPLPQIAVTGIRAGERLSEPLRAPDERLELAPLPGLLVVRSLRRAEPHIVAGAVRRVAELAAADAAPDAFRDALFTAVRTLQS